jgi:hypothetical protein
MAVCRVVRSASTRTSWRHLVEQLISFMDLSHVRQEIANIVRAISFFLSCVSIYIFLSFYSLDMNDFTHITLMYDTFFSQGHPDDLLSKQRRIGFNVLYLYFCKIPLSPKRNWLFFEKKY